ncbi:MAG TPA: hypothetical protein VMU57_10240, partial [Edaphobacter sp.]|nr:hypothetical protein [Edaphobacter sp.]
MPESNQNPPATVPEQPEAKPPVRKGMPVVIALVAIIALIGIANLSSLLSGTRKSAPVSTMPMRPAAPNAQEVNSFESQQELQAKRDAEERQHQQELATAMQQLEAAQGVPGPEAAGAPPMTAAQRAAIYGESPNAPIITSDASQERAQAKQRELAKEKQQQDAIDSDTVAIDFEHPNTATPTTATSEAAHGTAANAAGGPTLAEPARV